MTEHTSREFAGELRALRNRLAEMGSRAARQLDLAMVSVAEYSSNLAHEVVIKDDQLDQDERAIDELSLQILATRQPVALDLRLVATALKMVIDLERIGDLATGIAKRVIELDRLPRAEVRHDLVGLGMLVQKNFAAALDAFGHGDLEQARQVIAMDREINLLSNSTFAMLVAHVATIPATITSVLPLTSVCRYLERIGDHVQNFAEDVIHLGPPPA